MEIFIMDINEVTGKILAKACEVHTCLGPGLLESAYEQCLCHELRQCGLKVERQKPLPVIYKGEEIECGYRSDIVVNGIVIIELKAVETIHPIHTAQLITYLKLSGIKHGLLINFNVQHLRDGIKRIVV